MATSRKKTALAVVYGGRSGEHEVSLRSARSVIAALDRTAYDILPLKIAKDGRWVLEPGMVPGAKTAGSAASRERILVPSPHKKTLLRADGSAAERVDIVLPLVHGTGGEDGALQGLFELAEVPYCGSRILGSSVGMDKAIQKEVLSRAGIPVVPYVAFCDDDWTADRGRVVEMLEHRLRYPMFIKPANLGSSVGISKAHHRKELLKGIKDALSFDTKVVVERAVQDAREIECAVLGNGAPETADAIGEIIPSNEFYDYAAKYVDDRSTIVIPAPLPKRFAGKVRAMASDAFKALEARGFARVDFLLSRDSNDIYLNEINTLPGFTSISMFPKLWEASGVPYADLLDHIVRLGFEEARSREGLVRDYATKTRRLA